MAAAATKAGSLVWYYDRFTSSRSIHTNVRAFSHDLKCTKHLCFLFKAREHDVAVGRYVIMPDHVHLFAAFPAQGITLSSWVQSLCNVIGKTLLRVGIHKPHLQEGFFDHLLRSQEGYSQKMGVCAYESGTRKTV
jgi:REP element-mobilizing transposase RayT